MVAMLQRLDARSFFLRPQLSVCAVSALVLEVFRNRFSCHGGSVPELSCSSCPILATRDNHGSPRSELRELRSIWLLGA